MLEQVPSRAFHCVDCEVGWVAGPECFCCGRDGTTGSLRPSVVEPNRRAGWAGPLARPAAYRTTARREAVAAQ